MRRRFLMGCLLVLAAAPVCAAYFVDYSGKAPVSADLARRWGWPKGALEVANAPSRVQRWHGYFTELPNDVEHYGYRLETAADANRLIELLAKVEGPANLVVSDEPRKDEGKERINAEFALGSQPVLDEWFKRLPQGKFGVQTLTAPPAAMPPTLTVFLGDGKVDRKDLRIPERFQGKAPKKQD